ncbi:MAG TPA: DUF305 domain-containing protein, partial [Gemmatimonadaceae bacterium]|nr:DUF305 domain-containing protein [Gemmatimonadaceae bacterium]
FIAAGALAALVATACRASARQTPAAAPAATMPAAGAPADADSTRRGSAADVRFMQQMIAHHAQALAMTGLVPTRTGRDAIRLLAERVEVSQRDEIAAMQRWLKRRGEQVPGADAHHDHGAADQAPMPGMLTPAELAELAGASGALFDRLFLERMIRHHEGALTMVADLFATPGAAQESEVFRFASDVDADQRAEIARMRAVLAARGGAAPQ